MRTYRRLRAFFEITTFSVAALAPACGGAVGDTGSATDPGTSPRQTDAQPSDPSTPTVDAVAAVDAADAADATTPTAEPALCDGNTWKQQSGLAAGTGSAFVELRSLGPSGTIVATSDGVPCAGATDNAACIAALADARANADASGERIYSFGSASYALVYTRGDAVGVVSTKVGLQTFLVPIGSVKTAALWAAASGYTIVCPQTDASLLADGVRLRLGGCVGGAGGSPVQTVSQVSAAGQFTDDLGHTPPRADGCGGRRPEGFIALPATTHGATSTNDAAIASYFVELAQLEAASVDAFQRLARELEALSAPPALVRRARAAARDEVRHAATMTMLARRFGAEVPAVPARVYPLRALADVAIENAVEGCVREAFAALLATYQAQHASDSMIRAAMKVVARDETRHAALALDVAAWAEARLGLEERAAIALQRRATFDALEREVGREDGTFASARAVLGLPSGPQTVAMVRAFARFSTTDSMTELAA